MIIYIFLLIYVKFQVLCIAAVQEVALTSKESRTGGLNIPEKIIGGVIEIVQSHKNKPVPGAQPVQPAPSYPPNPQYNYQQYPQYQQWNSQSSFQNQGFQGPQYPVQYPSQGQYNYQNNYNQAGNYPQGSYSNQVYPTGTGQTFTQGQAQQGQYQGTYQNQNQFNQPNNFQNQQSNYYTQNQGSNQYQGSTSSFQGQTSQAQGPGQGQGQAIGGNGQFTQGFLVSGQGNAGGQGPTCVCQAWTKPQPNQEILADTPATEKTETKEETNK